MISRLVVFDKLWIFFIPLKTVPSQQGGGKLDDDQDKEVHIHVSSEIFHVQTQSKVHKCVNKPTKKNSQRNNQHTTKAIQHGVLWEAKVIIAAWLPVSVYLSARIGHRNQSNSPIQTADNDSLSQFRSPDQIKCSVFPCVITPDVSFPDFSDHVLQVFRVNIDAIFGSILHEQAVSFLKTIIGKKPPRRLWYPP